MKPNQPTFFQIFRGDGISQFLAWGPLISIAIGLYFYFSKGRVLTTFLWLMIGLSILEIVVLFFRYKRVTSIFANGIEASGIVTEVFIPEGDSQASPHVAFTYEFQGEKYQSRSSTSEKKAKSLTVGQTITIILDSNKPKSAFVKELFLGKSG